MDAEARHQAGEEKRTSHCAVWRRRRQLGRELAEYHTQAEREDLLAAVAHCTSPECEEACQEVRRLLSATPLQVDLKDVPYHLHREHRR